MFFSVCCYWHLIEKIETVVANNLLLFHSCHQFRAERGKVLKGCSYVLQRHLQVPSSIVTLFY